MIIRKASIKDTDTLIKLRLDYLKADLGSLTETEETKIRRQLEDYFPKHIGRDFTAEIAEIDGKAAASVFYVAVEKPANTVFLTGKIWNLLNVFTYPEYRKKGIATKILNMVIDDAKKNNVSLLELSATKQGKPLYEKLGFVRPETEYTSMRLKLI